jgi:hypothetical protein
VKKVKKEVQVKKATKATKVKKVTKEIKDFLAHLVIKDLEEIKVFVENKVKGVKKDIWDTEVLREIRAQLESQEVRANLVKLEYQVIKAIKETKEKPDPWVTRAIKEKWECKEKLENQVILEALEKLEKEVLLEFQERGACQVTKEFVETKEIRAKEAIKEREDYRASKVSAEIAENRERRGLLVRKVFREIRVPEEIRASVEIRV